mgnify:CR=1 FL=1
MTQILLSRVVDQISFIIKAGTVTGAVPAFFIRIPFKLTTKMRAADGNHIVVSGFIAVNADFFYRHVLQRRRAPEEVPPLRRAEQRCGGKDPARNEGHPPAEI